jgi:catechol 2,3-dioxygenase-like lactoylglutathione lyase family enzyme
MFAGRARDGSSMNLVSITPNFIVKDLQASIAFYREGLGFKLDYQGPDDGLFWAKVSFIDAGPWGFEIFDEDGYLLAFFRLRDKERDPEGGDTVITS